MTAPTTTSPSPNPFQFGQAERRTFPLSHAKPRLARCGGRGPSDGKLQVVGIASVFDKPSISLASPLGSFTETIARGAFDRVLRSRPSVIGTWDHDISRVLASTDAGSLELSIVAEGLRYYMRCSDTSYSRDLAELMADGVIRQSSFLFTVAPGGETWKYNAATGTLQRTITEVGSLFDVCLTARPAYPDTDASLVGRAVSYAVSKGYLASDPAVALRVARAKAELNVARRRLATSS